MPRSKTSDIEKFIALPDSEKDRMAMEIESESQSQRLARSRALNVRERAQWRRFKRKAGRPKIGEGTKTISLTVEIRLLKRADAYAKQHGISRAKLVAQGLAAIIGSAA